MVNFAVPSERGNGGISDAIKKLLLEGYRISEHLETQFFNVIREISSIGEKM